MKASLVAALAALVAAVGVVAWGVASAPFGRHTSTASRHRVSFTPAPKPSPSATAADLMAGMRLVFHQSFTAPLDTTVWGTCYPWASGSGGCTNFANTEYEWYLPSQVQVSAGALRLTAEQAPTQGTSRTGQAQSYGCRSGMVTSYPGFRFEYGYVSFVAQIPTATGLWSGLWLAAASLKWPPEIDLLERWGPPRNIAAAYFHPVGAAFTGTHLNQQLAVQTAAGWHTYSVMWAPSQITWYVDNHQILTITKRVPHQPMYLIADLANYAKSGGCAGQLAIRSIDVWQH